MSASPIFSQKHYEKMIAGLRMLAEPHDRIIAADVVSRDFLNDNPGFFKRPLFMAQVMETENETPKT
jgi:hypothetical protein